MPQGGNIKLEQLGVDIQSMQTNGTYFVPCGNFNQKVQPKKRYRSKDRMVMESEVVG